jgi:aminoglycoside phosphotransferase (APT) family kinase protein
VDIRLREPAEVAASLRAWLTNSRGLDRVEVDNLSVPAGSGASNETILFDATWSGPSGPEHHPLVARIAPTSYVVFPDDTFTQQFQVMRALAEVSSVPMARAYWYEPDPTWFDAPFWIMERVAGQIPGDMPPYAMAGWLVDATPEQQHRAWASGLRAMAHVHAIPPAAVGLPPAPDDPLGAEIDRYARFLAWAEEGETFGLARDTLTWLRRNQPPAAPPTLCWGDSRLANLIFQDFEVAAVLDWEMATVCDPLLDLGWWLFADEALSTGVGVRRLPGFLSREETAKFWRKETGRPTDSLPFYEVFAGFRFTVIMLRIGKLLVERGRMPASFPHDNMVSQTLSRLLARV